jgi:3-dehydroquinate dehydratase-1
VQRRHFLIGSAVAAASMPLSRAAFAAQAPVVRVPATVPGTAVLTVKNLQIGRGAPKIIASITAKNDSEALGQARDIGAAQEVDMAELRLDHLDQGHLAEQVKPLLPRLLAVLAGKPLLVTWRSQAEGGERAIGDADYFGLYAELLKTGHVDVLDVEMMKPEAAVKNIVTLAHERGVAVVLSNHDFQATPSQDVLVERLRRQQDLGADILKIAVMPNSKADVLTLMAASQHMQAHYARRPLLTMSMGPTGVLSRLAGQLSGSALTYASLGQASAPGQLDASAVRKVLQVVEEGAQG